MTDGVRGGLRLLVASLALAATTLPAVAGDHPATAQLLGTVHATRTAWNPFATANEMRRQDDGSFTADLTLRTDGGRNQDGIYALRFVTDRELRQTYKRGKDAGTLVTGPDARFAGNVVFRVPADGTYRVTFDPATAKYSFRPAVDEIERIDSMQLNGFVHDREGSTEAFDGRRTRPAEMWDEWVPAHELKKGADGSWSIELPLKSNGGHQKNGVYQALLSANHVGDWGYSAILGQPGRLAGGNGYNSRVGHAEETAIVFKVVRDGNYKLTVWPGQYRFEISPSVEFFPGTSYQVNGDVVPDPWNPQAPGHEMTLARDGTFFKLMPLKSNGGAGGKGVYRMNFSIDGQWALDSIGFGGDWGRTWHSAPQEWTLLFRVPADGDYRVTLDPARGRFTIDPPVTPVVRVESLQIFGNFEVFAGDGQGGWNPAAPDHDMQATGHGVFTRDIRLSAGRSYQYKYGANWSHWAWTLADYPYDGERRLAPHGDPAPLQFTAPRDGIYRFVADTESGDYSVFLVKHD